MTRLVERKIGAAAAIDPEVLERAGLNVLRAAFAQLRASLVRNAERKGATPAPGQRIRYTSQWHTEPEYRGYLDGQKVHLPERRVLFVRAQGRYLIPEEEV